MLNISASPEEMREYFGARQTHTSQALERELRALGGELTEGQAGELDGYVSAAERFYRTAEARSAVLVKNLTARMQLLGQDIAVLVSGGYHTPGIQKALEAAGCTYVTIQPRLKYDDLVNPYFQLLQNRKLPIQKLIEKNQTQLALPPRLAPLLDFKLKSNAPITQKEIDQALKLAPDFMQCCKELEADILPLLEDALGTLASETNNDGDWPRQVVIPNQMGVTMVVSPSWWRHPDLSTPQIKIGGLHAYLVKNTEVISRDRVISTIRQKNLLIIVLKIFQWPWEQGLMLGLTLAAFTHLLPMPVLSVPLVALAIGIGAHESAHALVAWMLGDRTAVRSGRLNLAPWAHVNWQNGQAGWFKGVYTINLQAWRLLLVKLAGPIANLGFGVIFLMNGLYIGAAINIGIGIYFLFLGNDGLALMIYYF
jgi:hypothetical protein